MTLSTYADPYMELNSNNRIAKAAIRAFVAHFSDHDYAHCTSEDWITFFKAIPRASVATLRRYRSTLLTFLLWIGEQGSTDVSASIASLKALDPTTVRNEAKNALLRGYFGSYDGMMDAVEQALNTQENQPLFAPILCAMITLVWYGVPWRLALDIRKDEVMITDGLCIIKGRYQIRHERAIAYLRAYLYAKCAYDVHNRTFTYLDSDWLFRSHTSDHLSEESFGNRVWHFNSVTKGDTQLSMDRIHESAVFAKGYAIITNMGMLITSVPHPVLVSYFDRIFEFTPSEMSDDRYRSEAWELFYRWCEKFRSVSPL